MHISFGSDLTTVLVGLSVMPEAYIKIALTKTSNYTKLEKLHRNLIETELNYYFFHLLRNQFQKSKSIFYLDVYSVKLFSIFKIFHENIVFFFV